MADPLILTLRLDDEAFATFDRLRQELFPDRGYTLPAHLTLFHALPGDRLDEIDARLADLAEHTARFPLEVTRVLDFNPGAAFRIDSDRLRSLRKSLARDWDAHLTAQDRHFNPHVTVQNKVPKAESAYAALAAAFQPYTITATGLLLWHYRGGPWERARDYRFGGIE